MCLELKGELVEKEVDHFLKPFIVVLFLLATDETSMYRHYKTIFIIHLLLIKTHFKWINI